MPKRHTIDLLPTEIRNQVRELVKDQQGVEDFAAAINEILEEEGLDVRVSRSSAHRYMQRNAKLGERLRQSQELADTFAGDLKGMADDKRVRYLASLVQELAYDYVGDAFERADQLGAASETAKSLQSLGKLTRDLAATFKDSAALRDQLRAEIVDDVVKRAVAAAETGAKKAGVRLGQDALDEIRRQMGLIR